MKNALNLLIVFSIIAMFMIMPVAAATSDGLEWGIKVGDRFDYSFKSSMFAINEDMYMNITSMPAAAIPDPLTSWVGIPDLFAGTGFWWANGTSMGSYSAILILLIAVGGKIAVPIGNFTHIQSLAAALLTGETFVNEANVWGISWTTHPSSTVDFKITATYAKADGFLAQFKMETINSGNSQVLNSTEITRYNIPGGGFDLSSITQMLQDNILYVGIGVGILVILAIVCKKR